MPLLKAVFRDQAFRIHAIVYAGVNLLLATIDLLSSPGSTWFQWPLLGWGIGLLAHGGLVAWQKRHTVRRAH